MLNKVILQGRLGADPELRTTPTGVEVATVNIAVDRDRKDADGNRLSDWVTIVAWRNTAKFLSQYFQKGKTLIVDGRLQMRNWTDTECRTLPMWRKLDEMINQYLDNISVADLMQNEQECNYVI